MASYGKAQVGERYLEERAYLLIVFPEKGKGHSSKSITSSKKVKLPFYENPIIQESKASRLATYKLLGRNSDLFSYLGADARTINLEVSLTLPHLHHFLYSTPWLDNGITLDSAPKFKFLKREQPKPDPFYANEPLRTLDDLDEDSTSLARKNSNDPTGSTYTKNGAMIIKSSIASYDQEYDTLINNDAAVDALVGDLLPQSVADSAEPDPKSVRAAYLYYINLLRATVLGSEELGIGCPIVRLNFGALYQDIPLIVTKYDLDIEDRFGYDTATLLPRRVTIKMQMLEVRVGDFSAHRPKQGQADDNVPTWESVLNYGTTDPRESARITRPRVTTFNNFGGPGDSYNIPRRRRSV